MTKHLERSRASFNRSVEAQAIDYSILDRRLDMQIMAYGEDALTLWAIRNKLQYILHKPEDDSAPSDCQSFFRPSFGRRGGDGRSEFGEFDFIILSKTHLYLGESKWDQSSEVLSDGTLELRTEQTKRHDIFRFYIDEWAFGKYSTWEDFRASESKSFQAKFDKTIPSATSRLGRNLQTVLGVIRDKFPSGLPPSNIVNVLLYLHRGLDSESVPKGCAAGFRLVTLDYSEACKGNFISIEL